MRRSSYYRAQADHARRLADITAQLTLKEVLRHVAEELDRLANDVATPAEADSRRPETPPKRKP